LLGGRLPHGVTSLCIGLCITGLLCTLMPGLTALRLKLVGSKSSSRLRLLLTFRVISAAVGAVGGCGVADLEGEDVWGSELLAVCWLGNSGGVERDGESRDISSLMPEDDPRGRKAGGGVRLLSSVKVSQNSLPFEFRIACCLKLLERPVISSIISSSNISPKESCVTGPRFGEEWVVVVVDMEGRRVGSRSISLSRVRRTTSASRRTSVSIGVLSSASAARIRAKPFVLGYIEFSVWLWRRRIDRFLPACSLAW